MKSRPIKTAGYCSHTLHDKRDRKRDEADARAHAWAKLTPEQQRESLLARRGSSAKQLARIAKGESK